MKTAFKEKDDLTAVRPEKWHRSRKLYRILSFGTGLQFMWAKALIPADKQGDMWFYREDEINNIILRSIIYLKH